MIDPGPIEAKAEGARSDSSGARFPGRSLFSGRSIGPCDACEPKGSTVVQDRAQLCRGCDLAARLIEARASLRVLAERDAAYIRGTEIGTFAALRRIGAACFPGYTVPEGAAPAGMTAGKMLDQLDTVRLGPRGRKRVGR